MSPLQRGCGSKALLEVSDDVVDVLAPDGQADRIRADSLVEQLLFGQLRMRCRCRMDDQALHVGHVRKQAEDLERVDEGPGLGLAALDVEGEDRGAAVREVARVDLVIRMVGQARVAHAFNERVVREEVDDLRRVLGMAVET